MTKRELERRWEIINKDGRHTRIKAQKMRLKKIGAYRWFCAIKDGEIVFQIKEGVTNEIRLITEEDNV